MAGGVQQHKVTDAYLPEGRPDEALFFPGPRAADRLTEEGRALGQLAEGLTAEAESRAGEDSFTICLPSPFAGDRAAPWLFRVQRTDTVSGARLAFRRLADEPPDLDGLLPRPVSEALAHPSLCRGGLLIVCGGPGQGKTTTLAAVVAARLRTFGGVCVAAEDPPEIPLDGRHGPGLCMQVSVTRERPLDLAIHAAMRMFPVGAPGILLLGEVRSRQAADEALCAALNGTLVCMTLHAASQVEALHRLAALAGGDALSALSASLRGVYHQRLVNRTARIRPLVVPEAEGETVRGSIRSGRFELLASEIQRQQLLLDQGRPLPV